MTTSITLRATKGSALTHDEMDTNLTNLQTTADAAVATGATLTADKAEAAALGVGNTDQNMGSFTGTTIADNVSAKVGMQSLETAVETKANATAVGVTAAAANMGTYTGATIPDNETAKQNLQSLETAVETKANASALGVTASAADMGTFTGSTISDSQTAKQALQALETAVENRTSFSAEDYGAVGDGATDDTASFTTLETAITGSAINLGGLTYLVTTVPTGNDYFNGAFKVGTNIRWRARNPRNSPFDSPTVSVKFVDPKPRVYRGLNVALFPTDTDGVWVMVWREARGHGVEVGTRLMAARTDDGGNSFLEEPYLIFTQSDVDTRNFAAGVMNGRFGIVAARVEAGSTHQDPIFIYSDDDGVTWTSAAITAPTSTTTNFHSKIIPYPAAAGGSDTNGFVCYYYHSAGISVLKTTDNGANWSETANAVVPDGSFPSISEMSVARVGSETKWVMVIRTSAGLNAVVSVSSNLTTWSAIADSGLLLDQNPPELFYDDGRLWLLSYSRRDKPIIAEFENAIVIAGGLASTVYSSGGTGGWSGWKVLTTTPFWPSGYISVEKVRDRWYGLWNCEDYAGSTQSRTGYLMLLSSDPVATASLPAISKMIPNRNLALNGGLQVWQKGTTLTGTTRDMVADGFTFARQSSVGGWTVSRVAGDKARYAMRVQRDDADTATQIMALSMNLSRDDSRPLRSQQVTLHFRARKGAGFSAADDFLFAQLRQTNHTSEQSITIASGLYSTGDTAVGSSSTGVTLTTDWQRFKLTPGKLNDDATQLMVRWYWTPVGTATDDYYEIELVKIEIGAEATPFIYERFEDVLARCQSQYEVTYDYGTTAGTVTNNGALQERARGTESSGAVNMPWRFAVAKRAVPTITLYSPGTGTAAKMYDLTGTADINATTENVGLTGASIINNAATTSGNTYRAHAVAKALL